MGQIGSAITNPNTFAPQPSGFNGSEWAARFMGGAAKGLGQGLQNNMQMRPQGGATTPIPMSAQPQVSLPTESPQLGQSRKPNSLFYGYGSGQ